MKAATGSAGRRQFLYSALGVGVAALSMNVCAQSGGTLTFLVPQPAGSATDALARKAATVVGKTLNQTVIVENFPGAGGSLGLARALAAPGDGQVVVFGSQTEFILTPLAFAGAKHRPEDFRCVAIIGSTPHMLATRPDMPANTFAALVARARQGQPLSYGHIGRGSLIHLMTEQFRRGMRLALVDVPYKGVPPIVQELIGGQIDMAFLPIGASTLQLVNAGKIKALGTTSKSPTAELPNVPQLPKIEPTLQDLVFSAWSGVFISEKTSFATTQRLHKGIAEFLNDEDAKTWLATSGVKMEEPRTLAQLDQFYRSETRRYQAIAKQMDISPQ
jgi:tripartite-type tricarboxylate transporter receptor subunit TctC